MNGQKRFITEMGFRQLFQLFDSVCYRHKDEHKKKKIRNAMISHTQNNTKIMQEF